MLKRVLQLIMWHSHHGSEHAFETATAGVFYMAKRRRKTPKKRRLRAVNNIDDKEGRLAALILVKKNEKKFAIAEKKLAIAIAESEKKLAIASAEGEKKLAIAEKNLPLPRRILPLPRWRRAESTRGYFSAQVY